MRLLAATIAFTFAIPAIADTVTVSGWGSVPFRVGDQEFVGEDIVLEPNGDYFFPAAPTYYLGGPWEVDAFVSAPDLPAGSVINSATYSVTDNATFFDASGSSTLQSVYISPQFPCWQGVGSTLIPQPFTGSVTVPGCQTAYGYLATFEGVANETFVDQPLNNGPGFYEFLGDLTQTDTLTVKIDYSTASELPEPVMFWPLGLGVVAMVGMRIRRKIVSVRPDRE